MFGGCPWWEPPELLYSTPAMLLVRFQPLALFDANSSSAPCPMRAGAAAESGAAGDPGSSPGWRPVID